MLFGTILAVLALNPPFCDHAVVQREKTLTVWGEGAVAGERLQLDFAGARTWTKANADGTFRFLVPPQKAGGPFELKVSGAKSGEAFSVRVRRAGEVLLERAVRIGDVASDWRWIEVGAFSPRGGEKLDVIGAKAGTATVRVSALRFAREERNGP